MNIAAIEHTLSRRGLHEEPAQPSWTPCAKSSTCRRFRPELAAKASKEHPAAVSLRALEKHRDRAELEGMAELTSGDRTRDDAAPIVAIILAAETLRDRALAMLNTTLDRQREAAKLARELGADAHPMPDHYTEALLTLARFDRLPEAEKIEPRRYAAVDQVVKTFDPRGLRTHNPTLSAARLYLSHPHWRTQGCCAARERPAVNDANRRIRPQLRAAHCHPSATVAVSHE